MTNGGVIRATSFEDAARALKSAGAGARIVAGGTDLMVDVGRTAEAPRVWIDLNRIKGTAREIRRTADSVRIGALVTFQELAESEVIRETLPALWDAANIMGSIAIRNRGTVGGNVAHGSPAGDSIPPFYVAEASVELVSADATRLLPIHEFYLGPRRTLMEAGEVLSSICYSLRSGTVSAFHRLGIRSHHEISKVSFSLSAVPVEGRLTQVRAALGAVAPTVIRAREVERVLEGLAISDEAAFTAGKAAAEEASPIDDIRSTREYRTDMCRELVSIVLEKISKRMLVGE